MSKPEKKALVPTLRFPEFQNEPGWQEKKLGKAAENLDFKRIPITEADRVKGTVPYYGASGIIDYVKDYIFNEDLLCISEDGANLVARTYPIAFPISGKTWVNNHAHVLKFKHRFTQVIVENYLNAKNLEDFLTGMAQPKLNRAKLDIIPIPLPGEEEQQKIADCLSSIDDLITAQTQKLAALKAHKKGLMQQLFPAEGETVPELRFPEFRDGGEWVEIELEKLVDIRSGFSPSKYNLAKEAKYAFLKVEDLNNCEKYQNESREYSDDLDGLVPVNSVIFPKRGAAILLNKVRINTQDVLMDTNLMAITPNKKILVEFLYYTIVSVGLFKIADTSTIPQINNKHINPYQILIPSKPEQQKIADCLSSVDELITAQSEKIEALKSHKKGLMQQLFPSMDEVDG